MSKLTRMVLVAANAVVALALISGVAAASRGLGFSYTEGETITGSGRTTFEEGEPFRVGRIMCAITIGIKATTRLIEKARGGVIGEVTSGITAGCLDSVGTRAQAFVLAEATTNRERHPFPMFYSSFLGTLPEITGVLVSMARAAFLLEDPGRYTTCLYEGTQGFLFSIQRGTIQSGSLLEREILNKVSGPSECPLASRWAGTVTFNRRITITLLN